MVFDVGYRMSKLGVLGNIRHEVGGGVVRMYRAITPNKRRDDLSIKLIVTDFKIGGTSNATFTCKMPCKDVIIVSIRKKAQKLNTDDNT